VHDPVRQHSGVEWLAAALDWAGSMLASGGLRAEQHRGGTRAPWFRIRATKGAAVATPPQRHTSEPDMEGRTRTKCGRYLWAQAHGSQRRPEAPAESLVPG